MIIKEEKITQQGKELLLRCPCEEDAEMLLDYLKKTCAETRFLVKEPEEIQMTLEQEKDYIRRNLESDRDLTLLGFLDGRYVGNCSLKGMNMKRYQHRIGMGIALFQEFTGLGIGRRMIQKMIFVAKDMGVEQMELEVNADNYRAIHLYEALGFEIRGTFPNNMKYKDGTYADAHWMVKNLKTQSWKIDGVMYSEVKLLGKGKGGYSYLVTDGNKEFVLKQIHHEPCDYYAFGDKLEAELRDYEQLKKIGIAIPTLIAVDQKGERIVKEYIEGETIDEYVNQGKMQIDYFHQVEHMAKILKDWNLNIDYYPTNFVVSNEKLFYIDYECNEYMEEWNFENWGKNYWIKN